MTIWLGALPVKQNVFFLGQRPEVPRKQVFCSGSGGDLRAVGYFASGVCYARREITESSTLYLSGSRRVFH